MMRDPLWRQIKRALEKPVDPGTFERCAQDLLRQVYPGLAPVVGGSDAGMDGSIPSGDGVYPLICTTGEDVLGNFRNSINNHLAKRSGPHRCVLATSQALTPQRRDNLLEVARSLGVVIHQIHDREDFVGRLYVNAAWRHELLGVSGTPPALSAFPPSFRQVEASLLIGRDEDVAWLRDVEGDALIVGQPGFGKTHLHQHMVTTDEVLFAVTIDETQLANAIREQQPKTIVVDDAHVRLDWIDQLRRLRVEIGAGYRIHANCWPNFAVQVQNRLGISPVQTRQLGPIPRKQMHELIQSLGIGGPDQLLFLLLEQSAGRPGLCATLVDACKRGEVDRIWTGDALADRLLVVGALLRDEVDRELLARFALGGDAGVRIDAVAAGMEMKRFELRERVTSLGVGGVIAEVVADDRLVVLPEPLRAVLVRDVFFKGPVRPSLEDSLASCWNAASATHVLISTKQRDVAVSGSLIRERVHGSNEPRLWEHYAFLDEQAANDILDSRRGVVCQAGKGLLHLAPRRAAEALIRSDEATAVKTTGDTHHPHRLITEWISDWDHEEETAPRRQIVLEALERVQASTTPFESPTVLKYLRVVLDPTLHGIKTSPADHNTVIYRRGVHTEASIREIAGLWPRVLALLPFQMLPAWRQFLDGVGDWAWPGRGDGNLPATQADFMKQTARGFVSDMLALPQCGRALRKALRWIDRNAALGVGIPRDDIFDTILDDRDHGESWEAHQAKRSAELEALAHHFVALGWLEATTILGDIEREVADFGTSGDGWDRLRLYDLIASRVVNPLEWLVSLVKKRVPANLAAPFIEMVRRKSPDHLVPILRQLLDDKPYMELARREIVQERSAPSDLVDRVISTLEPVGDHDAYRFQYQLVPIDRMLRLLTHDVAEIRLGAALGEWHTSLNHAIRSELVHAWKETILAAEPRRESDLTALMAAEVDLALQWAKRRIEAGEHGVWRLSHEIARIAETLNPEQRHELAITMNRPDRYDAGVFDALIGLDETAFRAWIAAVPENEMRVLSLQRPPSDLWRARTIVALDAGVPPELLVELIGGWGDSWSGPASSHFQTYVDAYDAFLKQPDTRLHVIAARGREWAQARVKEALRREFLQSI